MIPSPLLGKHRSALLTAVAVTVVSGVIAGVAIASGGYSAQRVDLGDAAVWVASDENEAIGRANTAVHELNSVVETGGTGSVVIQDGATVLVLDPDRASVGVIDATSSTLTETVAVPPDDPALALAGSNVVISASGDVWIIPIDEFAEFDSRIRTRAHVSAPDRSRRSIRRARSSPIRPRPASWRAWMPPKPRPWPRRGSWRR